MSRRLFVTGDIHQSIDIQKLRKFSFILGEELTKNDILIILGDVGLVYQYGINAKGEEEFWRNWVNNRPWTTFCVLGNHEAYSHISEFPIVDFCGAPARQIADSIFYAETANIYNLNGKKCLVVNGADSVDKELRKENISWWAQERITIKDVNKAKENLKKNNYIVDLVLSHTGGEGVCKMLHFSPTISDNRLTEILHGCKYEKMYCGHYHRDLILNNRVRVVYNDILEID